MGSTKMFLSKLRVIRSVMYLILRVILSVMYLILRVILSVIYLILRVILSVIYLILRVILSVIYLISFRLQSETILSLPANQTTEIDTKNSFICQFVFPSSRSNSLLDTH